MHIDQHSRIFGTIRIVLAACALVAVSAAARADSYIPVYRPEITISRAAGPIKIDGDLSDAGWVGAAKAANFAEHNPGNQTKPEVDTEVLIAYDDENLYVAWLCYDDPAAVRASFCERDKMFSGDYVILCLDTYGEATHAFEIAANPYGVPGDLLFSSTHGEDSGYDMIFKSSGRITDKGWVAEMAVPFSSLRFPGTPDQTWRVDFWRNRPRESRFQYSWAAYNRDEDCWPCQWGTMKGISGIKPGKGLELLPAVVAHEAGYLGDDGSFVNDPADGEFGLGLTYDISSEMSAEATFNPDFSQIETDVAQIDVNSTFALFYPEKRPFFQEGSDLFNSYFNAVYTRSINDPNGAAKLTWRSGATSMALLSAQDQHSVIILPFEESSEFVENGKSFSNLFRMRRDFGRQSHVGLIATNRIFDGGGMGSLLSVDTQVRLSASNSFRVQAMTSQTEEVDNLALVPDSAFNASRFADDKYTAGLDGESYWGHALAAGVSRNTANYGVALHYNEMSPTFRADNGFEPQNNQRIASADANGTLRFENSKILEYVQLFVQGGRKWNFDGVRKDEWISPNLEMQFRAAQTSMHANAMASNELFQGTQFNGIWSVHNCIHTQPWNELSLGANVNYGHRIARYQMVMGKQLDYGVSATIRPIDRVTLALSLNHTESDDVNTDERLFEQSVFWSRLSLQMTRELSLRLVSQYNNRYRTWDVDPLLTYQINSFSLFYFGSTHDYRTYDYEIDGREGYDLTERQFFLKFQYLFQI